jgi:hypothetical protein
MTPDKSLGHQRPQAEGAGSRAGDETPATAGDVGTSLDSTTYCERARRVNSAARRLVVVV